MIQSTQGIAITKKEKSLLGKAWKRADKKEPKDNRCLWILDFKSYLDQKKRKNSPGKEIQSLAVPRKKLFIKTSL